MDIDWTGFLQVFVISFASAVGVMVLFAIAVALLSPSDQAPRTPSAGSAASLARHAGMVGSLVAVLCFLACGAVIVYGLFLIVS